MLLHVSPKGLDVVAPANRSGVVHSGVVHEYAPR